MVSLTLPVVLTLTLLTLTGSLVQSEDTGPLEQDLQVLEDFDDRPDFEDEPSGLEGRVQYDATNSLTEGLSGLFQDFEFSSYTPFWSRSNPENGIGTTSSTVYAYSYENILVIFAIKALLALAVFGGFGFVPFVGRSVHDTSALGSLLGGTDDLLFTLAYLNGRPDVGYSCLQRLACLQPARGEDILLASGMLEKAVHYVQSWTSESISSPHPALPSLEEALDYSNSGGDCRQRYSCSVMPSL